MGDDDELDERNAFLMAMLGLVALADDALTLDAPSPEQWAPSPHRDDGPLLR